MLSPMLVIISKKCNENFEKLKQEKLQFFDHFYKNDEGFYCNTIWMLMTDCFNNHYPDYIPLLITYNINFMLIDCKTYESSKKNLINLDIL